MKTTAHDLASTITHALAVAFGGYSQFSDDIVGQAIFGHANNDAVGWSTDRAREVVDAAAKIIADHWDLPASQVGEKIREGYAFAAATTTDTHAPLL